MCNYKGESTFSAICVRTLFQVESVFHNSEGKLGKYLDEYDLGLKMPKITASMIAKTIMY
jgi:hypothetical protein